jgi:hypothetical protein
MATLIVVVLCMIVLVAALSKMDDVAYTVDRVIFAINKKVNSSRTAELVAVLSAYENESFFWDYRSKHAARNRALGQTRALELIDQVAYLPIHESFVWAELFSTVVTDDMI